MLGQIFPKQIDNIYRGYWLAVWLLAPIVLVKAAMGLNSIINTRLVIESADKIPLDTYGAGAAATIIFLFKAWGLCLLLLSLLGALALIRYRAMVPLVYLLLLIENAGRKVMTLLDPLPTVASSAEPPSLSLMINLALITALLIGFALSLGTPRTAAEGHKTAT
jgi:hypothetical protein